MLISNYLFRLYFEADNGAPTGNAENPPPKPPEGGEGEQTPKTVSIEDYDKEVARANWASTEFRKLQTSTEAMQQKLDELEKAQTKGKAFDAEAATKEITTLREQLSGIESQRKTETVEREVRKALGKEIADDCWDFFWAAQKNSFDIVSIDGTDKVRHAATPYAELSEFIDQIPAAMRKSSVARGAGDPNVGNQGGNATALPGNWASLSQEQQRDWFIANPDFKLGR